MAELTPLQAAVLQVLSWQSPGYLCSPEASAFKSQGLEDTEGIKEALVFLQENGYVDFYTDEEQVDLVKVERDAKGKPIRDDITGAVTPIKDGDGNLMIETVNQVVDAGWVITDEGMANT